MKCEKSGSHTISYQSLLLSTTVLNDMIGFVTLSPFLYYHYYKSGQVTKPIIVVKICYKLLHVIQVAS